MGAIWWSPFSTDTVMTRAGAELRAHWVRFACGYPLKKTAPGARSIIIKSIGKA